MKLGRREFFFALALLVLFACAGLITLHQTNLQREQVLADIGAERQAVARLQQAASDLQVLRSRLDRTEKSYANFESALPRPAALTPVTDQITKLATASALMNSNVKAEAVTAGQDQAIDVSVSGDFDHLYAFLLQLEKQLQPMRVETMKLEQSPDLAGQARAQIKLSVLTRSEASAAVDLSTAGGLP